MQCLPCDGTFYCFPNFQAVIDERSEIGSDLELAEWFIEKAGVALVPGSAFGAPGYMRLSFATGMPVLKDALGRIRTALSS